MNFDLKEIPFSRFGSYLVISYINVKKSLDEGLYLRNIRGGDNDNGAVFKIDVLKNGMPITYEPVATPTLLRLQTNGGFVELCLSEPDCLRIYGKDLGIRLTMVAGAYDNAFHHRQESWQVNSFSKNIRFMFTPLIGSLNMDAPWNVNSCDYVIADFIPNENSHEMSCAIQEFITSVPDCHFKDDFKSCHEKVESEYSEWFDKTLETSDKYNRGRELASYITWSCVVRPEGNLTRHAMYMSKNWMTNIWSWDNCFNAMALIRNNPDLAWNQLMVFFDKQGPNGVLADFMNDQFSYWNCSKPPIHGWALSWMMRRSKRISVEYLKKIYHPLSNWTNWFFKERDVNNNGLPEYQHGNDSGWDNSTVFHKGIPVESPDLCAFLILQMNLLAEIAGILDLEEEKESWEELSEFTFQKMITYFWNGEQFTARYFGEEIVEGDSLLLYMPIILGKQLPLNIRTKLINGLKKELRFKTKYGLATESISSSYYIPDGYWRGPIWAPSTMLLIDGLTASGEKDFAQELARKFCEMANQNGMAENFNALTGEGLRDPAFTWTSSVFLVLANEYLC
ncbi:amylo-alpha-1,6-glucosidase [Virgibacillus siamensis]|uniref:amylo-alpha-1,6-glucosidase n=1 Tax=Virgibacillus siamensis TaxID=480071 RepID=UPI00098583B4|nr:trehalase family glycosidase [Virgibacillus siamensis]